MIVIEVNKFNFRLASDCDYITMTDVSDKNVNIPVNNH